MSLIKHNKANPESTTEWFLPFQQQDQSEIWYYFPVNLQCLALKFFIYKFKIFWKVMNTIQGQTRCPSVVSCYLTPASSDCLSV